MLPPAVSVYEPSEMVDVVYPDSSDPTVSFEPARLSCE